MFGHQHRRQMTLAAIRLPVLSLLAAAAVGGCGSSTSSTAPGRTAPGSHATVRTAMGTRTARATAPAVLRTTVTGQLPAPVMDPATTATGGGIVLMGGLDQADVSVSDIVDVGPGTARRIGVLPHPVHDAAAAALGGRAYLIGGGEPSYSEITAVDPTAHATVAGQLPAPASDVAAGVIGGTVYVVGGYTGAVPLDTIVAWSGSGTGRVVAHLPHPIRYAAVAVAGGRLIIAGGTSGLDATREVYAFDPATGRVSLLTMLFHPLTHAAAATLGGRVYVIGGRGGLQGTQRAEIDAINPATGRVVRAGRLPIALSDTGAAVTSGSVIVAGGRESSGVLSDHTYVLRPVAVAR
jgi:hypothetical protein